MDNWLNRDIGTDYWVIIDDYVEEPNHYIPQGELGHDRWRDAFIAGFDARNRMIDSHYYGVPQAINGVQIFCNLDILEASGVDFESEIIDPRWTFDDMLGISQRIADAGHTPWSLAWNVPYWNWIQTTSLSGFLKSTGKWSVLDTNNDDFVTSIERFKAIDRGDWTADSVEFRAMHQMAQDWTQYWSEGFLGLTSGEMTALFARGEAAFWWSTSNSYPVVQNDPLREFDFAIARFPLCFDRMATIGQGGPTQYPGGAFNTIAMTATATKNGTLDPCVDFMKLFTSCEGQGRLTREHGGVVPSVFCAEGRPELEQFKPDVGETFLLTIHMRSMHFDYGETYWRITSEWLGRNPELRRGHGQVPAGYGAVCQGRYRKGRRLNMPIGVGRNHSVRPAPVHINLLAGHRSGVDRLSSFSTLGLTVIPGSVPRNRQVSDNFAPG